MKKLRISIVLGSIKMTADHNKEMATLPLFALAHWKGPMLYYDVVLLDRVDGGSHYYIQVPGGNTVAGLLKNDGKYVLSGNSYRGIFSTGRTDSSWEKLMEPQLHLGVYFPPEIAN